MSDGPADAGAKVCVLLACFGGRRQDAKVRRELDERLEQSEDAILDQVVVAVNAKHRARSMTRGGPGEAP